MDNLSLGEFIKLALEYYDNQNLKYSKYLNLINMKNEKRMNVNIHFTSYDKNNNLITFYDSDDNETNFNYEVLGYFDNQVNIWIWGWLLPHLDNNLTQLCRDLLNYALKLEPNINTSEHYILKSLLLNSRISLGEYTELEINLAIIAYILKDKILFIYPYKKYLDEKKKNFITVYYLIKKL